MPKLENQTTVPLPVLRPRKADSHKGDYGRALLVGGSPGMAGAIAMSGMAALRTGAGLVTLVVPKEVQDVVSSFDPCLMTVGWESEADQALDEQFCDLFGKATAIAVGPGLGQSENSKRQACRLYENTTAPLVVDADGLNVIASANSLSETVAGDRILTPHPGEFARLAGEPRLAKLAKGSDEQRIEAAVELARRGSSGNTIIVLKGHHTVVTDGTRYALNQTGNPGMATGGSGDVLTGIITGLLCHGLTSWDAARLGVYVHGLAGDLAADEIGEISLVATDLIKYLSAAFRTHTAS